jgi:leader peptidase (prepilin peptidase)/N-methyltransferase
MFRIAVSTFAGLLGLAFGSFLNVCLTRWPAGESVVAPRSHCRNCQHTLAWWENVPLVSWIGLRGRCRGCGAWIGWRYPLVELAVGSCWALLGWRLAGQILRGSESRITSLIADYGTVIEMAILCLLLVGLACLDAEFLWLPDQITLPGIFVGMLFSVGLILQSETYVTVQPPIWQIIVGYFVGIIAAAGLILLIRWLYWLIRRREGIGLGDAKLMALLAAWLGLPGALLAFAFGVVLGALVAMIQLARPSTHAEGEQWSVGKLPLGTFLCVGGIVASLWGERLIAAYRQFAGF